MTDGLSQTGTVLIIGALGQIGQELTASLRAQYGQDRVIASDIRVPENAEETGQFVQLDVLNRTSLFELIRSRDIRIIYNLAAVLSAKGEQKPDFAWRLNMEGLLNTLEAARHTQVEKIFWPSSIAVFGPHSPQDMTPQYCIMDPNTVYGISKLAGERWCEYYAERYDVDVRSLRYPGLIGYKSEPGGGTTDYAVEIFHKALTDGKYTAFLKEGTTLPMMYMEDAIRATLEIMQAPADQIKIRASYNVAGLSFAPEELAAEIQKHLPEFTCSYEPDFRQQIADSWPKSIDDSQAHDDWSWKASYDLQSMVKDMILHLKELQSGKIMG